MGGCLSRERRRATKFEQRLRPHNTRRWSSNEGDYVCLVRGWVLLGRLLSCDARSGSTIFGTHGSTRERSRGVPQSLLGRMQACGRSARVLAHLQAKGQDESHEPSYWSDCTEWSNGLDASRSRGPAKMPSPACAKGLWCVRECTAIRNSDSTKEIVL